MNRRTLAVTIIAAFMAIGLTTWAETKEAPKKQTTCPVMTKNPINKNLYVDVKGKRIYVCCGGCIGKIKADPDKYIKQLKAAGIEIENTPAPKKTDKKDS